MSFYDCVVITLILFKFYFILYSNLEALIQYVLYALPIFGMLFSVPGFTPSSRPNPPLQSSQLGSSSTKSTEIIERRYGLKLPKGSYKPLALGGSDWYTFLTSRDHPQAANSNSISTDVDATVMQSAPSHSYKRSWRYGRVWLWVLGGYLVSIGLVRGIDTFQGWLIAMLGTGSGLHHLSESSAGVATVISFVGNGVYGIHDSSMFSTLLGAVAPGLLGPVLEEVMYRGYVLPCLASRWTLPPSLIISSLLFALQHCDLSAVLPLFTLSMLWSVLYIYTRSMIVPMGIHILWNLRPLMSAILQRLRPLY